MAFPEHSARKKLEPLLVIACIFMGCWTQEKFYDYAEILEGLKLNYTLFYEQIEEDIYFDIYSLSEKEHRELFSKYERSAWKFYHSDKGVIDYLLSFEQRSKYNQWLLPNKSPLSSNIRVNDFATESEAALILIDYYLRNKKEVLVTKKKPENLTYQNFHQFYNENKGKSIGQIRRAYKKFIRNANQGLNKSRSDDIANPWRKPWGLRQNQSIAAAQRQIKTAMVSSH